MNPKDNIKCCGVCIYMDDYETDLEYVWYCSVRSDIELMEKPYGDKSKPIECDFFERL